MFALPRTGRLGVNAQRARAAASALLLRGFGGCPKFSSASNVRPPTIANHARRSFGFTLIELLIVVCIIAVLLVLIAPAFTTIKGGTDITSAAYTIKGVLDTARTYAKANNTYAWVGFFEEDVSSGTPGTQGIGRLVMSIVASKDGTMIYGPMDLGQQNLTSSLVQVSKLTKIDNVHLWTHTDTPSGMR